MLCRCKRDRILSQKFQNGLKIAKSPNFLTHKSVELRYVIATAEVSNEVRSRFAAIAKNEDSAAA